MRDSLPREVRMVASIVSDHAVEVAGSNTHNDEQHGVSGGPKKGYHIHGDQDIHYKLTGTHNAHTGSYTTSTLNWSVINWICGMQGLDVLRMQKNLKGTPFSV